MAKREPWYKDGLCFSCTQCGDCCTGAPGVVWVNDEELEEMSRVLAITKEEVIAKHTRLVDRRRSLNEFANGDCTFFDPKTRKCNVYHARPGQCRTWPFWNSNLESPESWKETQQACPGAGRGAFVPLYEIERQRKVIDV